MAAIINAVSCSQADVQAAINSAVSVDKILVPEGDNPLDGNLDATGYPCKDQTGRTTDEDNDGIQDLVPQYQWGNLKNGVVVTTSVFDSWGVTTGLQLNLVIPHTRTHIHYRI